MKITYLKIDHLYQITGEYKGKKQTLLVDAEDLDVGIEEVGNKLLNDES